MVEAMAHNDQGYGLVPKNALALTKELQQAEIEQREEMMFREYGVYPAKYAGKKW